MYEITDTFAKKKKKKTYYCEKCDTRKLATRNVYRIVSSTISRKNIILLFNIENNFRARSLF